MNAIAIVSTNKDATTGGIAVIDISNGSSTCTNFKNSVCEPGQLCSVNGTSSYSGCGAISSGDFIVGKYYRDMHLYRHKCYIMIYYLILIHL